jgi:inorganic pyrophosphatase
MNPLAHIPPLRGENNGAGGVNVVIETPRGSRNKYSYDAELQVIALSGILPAGAVYPFDYGMIPGTRGEDGDPLDVLVLMDEPAFAGCLVPCRLIGAIRAKQTERDGSTEQNDRLIAVAEKSHGYEDVQSIHDLPKSVVQQIEHFFVSFNQVKGKKFKLEGRVGANQARKLVERGIRHHRDGREGKK